MTAKKLITTAGFALLATVLSSAALAQKPQTQASGVCNTVINDGGKTFSGACVPEDVLGDYNIGYIFEDDGSITYNQVSADGSEGSCWYQDAGTYGIQYLNSWLNGEYDIYYLPF